MTRLLIFLLVGVISAQAGAPVATITSEASFRIGGERVPANGVPNWPLVAGDEVELGNGRAVVKFPDGSRFVLSAKSRFRLEAGRNGTWLRVVEGTARVELSEKGRVEGSNDYSSGLVLARQRGRGFVPTAISVKADTARRGFPRQAKPVMTAAAGAKPASLAVAEGIQPLLGGPILPPRVTAVSESKPEDTTTPPGEVDDPHPVSEAEYLDALGGDLEAGGVLSGTLDSLPDLGDGESFITNITVGDGTAVTYRITNNGGVYGAEILLEDGSWAPVPQFVPVGGDNVGFFIGF